MPKDESRTRINSEDAKNVACLERLWALWRAGGDDNAELAAAINIAPELVKVRFRRDRAAGRSAS